MALPDIIEILPLPAAVHAAVTVPGSKSITNRALILAALAQGETVLKGALWSEDTQVMVECLQELGYMVSVVPDPSEPCNRTITVYGQAGHVPPGGTLEQPLELFVGNAGTAARFLAALVCLGQGTYRLLGVPRMHERPQAALFRALRELGYRLDSPNERLPAVIHGAGPRAGRCRVSIEESSQFASALLLCARTGRWTVEVAGESVEEAPYVAMTSKLLDIFPVQGGTFPIEPDCSSGSYFWAAGKLEPANLHYEPTVQVLNWPRSGWQMDEAFLQKGFGPLAQRSAFLGGKAFAPAKSVPPSLSLSRRCDLGDSIMTAIVLAPMVAEPVEFTDLGRLRVQECERVQALRTELTRCGAKVVEAGDTLTVFPSRLHGAEIETYNDHRMAMCFAILGLKIPGIRIKNPACVRKTFPNFFQKLATPPPAGLGVVITDGASAQRLTGQELFAD